MKKILIAMAFIFSLAVAVTFSMAAHPPGRPGDMPRTSGASLDPFTGDIRASTSDGPALLNESPTSGNPTIIPDKGDETDGLSGDTNALYLVVNGSNRVQIGANSTNLKGHVQIEGNLIQDAATSITLGAAATTMTISRNVHRVFCDAGGNTLSTITSSAGETGIVLTLIHTDSDCTYTDQASPTDDQFALAGNYTSADNSILQLVHDGTHWHEVSRNAN